MPVIPAPDKPTHELGTTRFTSLATPSTGSRSTSVWTVEIAADTPATPHSLSSEEILVVLDGHARVDLDDSVSTAGPGDAVVVPPGVRFGIAPTGDEPLRMLCCMPVGGQARTDDESFTPPWTM